MVESTKVTRGRTKKVWTFQPTGRHTRLAIKAKPGELCSCWTNCLFIIGETLFPIHSRDVPLVSDLPVQLLQFHYWTTLVSWPRTELTTRRSFRTVYSTDPMTSNLMEFKIDNHRLNRTRSILASALSDQGRVIHRTITNVGAKSNSYETGLPGSAAVTAKYAASSLMHCTLAAKTDEGRKWYYRNRCWERLGQYWVYVSCCRSLSSSPCPTREARSSGHWPIPVTWNSNSSRL